MKQLYDVVICGGGMAGQLLARQLKRTLPNLSVALIDRLQRPLPNIAFKVGESTAEAGTFYLNRMLDLDAYLQENHFEKMGLRYFFQSSNAAAAFDSRPEYGLTEFPAVGSYTIDRGKLENDLRQFNEADGVSLLEGMQIKEVQLGEDDAPHEITAADADGNRHTLTARWVVDATGRARFLQKRLKLERRRAQTTSAVWFRVNGWVDVSDFVPRDNIEWHARVPANQRSAATNHLLGTGYWIWLIPLPDNYTSVGIVTREDCHAFADFNTLPRARAWLAAHEPILAAHLDNYELLDFKCMRRCSYTAQKVFSAQRWACIGEAAVFSDPFYAPGTDMIAFGNTIVTELIQQEQAGTLTPRMVRDFNTFYLGLNDSLTDSIQSSYSFMGNPVVMTAKLLWDATAAWSFITPRMFNHYYLDAKKSAQIRAITAPFFALTRRMNQLFVDWGKLPMDKSQLTFEFIDYLNVPYLKALRQRNLQPGKEMDELIADQQRNMHIIEDLAQVLFLLAVEDALPEQLERFPAPVWINPWHASLNPDQWEQDGLFVPKTEPRDLTALHEEIRGLFFAKESVLS